MARIRTMNSLKHAVLALGLFTCITVSAVAQTTSIGQAGTRDFTDRASFATASGGFSKTIGFDGVRQGADYYSSYDHGPIVVSGITFSTSTRETFVDVTRAGYYSQGVYAGDYIVNSVNPSANNKLTITLPCPTLAIGIDFGGLGFKGQSSATITLSNGHTYNQASLPTVGHTAFVGFVSSDPIKSLTLDTVNDSWVVLDVVVADCLAQTTPTPSPTPEPTQATEQPPVFKQANITTTPRSASGTEVMKNSCVVQSYTSTPGLRSTPLLVADEYMASKGFHLIVDQNGNWIPLTATFQAGSTIPNLASLGGVYTPESTYNVTVSSGGAITVTETGSASFSFDSAGTFRQLTGNATWSATQKLDLNSGKDTLTFTASLDAQYIGGSQQEPGKASNCTINSRYSGEYDAVDKISFITAPGCQRFYGMLAEADQLQKLADLLQNDDQSYNAAALDMFLFGYGSPLSAYGLMVSQSEIPVFFGNGGSIVAVRSQIVNRIRVHAQNRARIAQIGLNGGPYGPPISKEVTDFFCTPDPSHVTRDVWDAFWMAGYIDYDTYNNGEFWMIIANGLNDFSVSTILTIADASAVGGALTAVTRYAITIGARRILLSEFELASLRAIVSRSLPALQFLGVRVIEIDGLAPSTITRLLSALASASAAKREEAKVAVFLAQKGLLSDFDVNILDAATGSLLTQLDILAGSTGKYVVEVTIGKGTEKIAQATTQAKLTGKEVIIYGTNLTSAFTQEARRQGFIVVQSLEELVALVKQ